MKFLTWCCCVSICVQGLQIAQIGHPGWRWVWIPLLVFYGLVGLCLAAVALYRLSASKAGVGGLRGLAATKHVPSTPHKEE